MVGYVAFYFRYNIYVFIPTLAIWFNFESTIVYLFSYGIFPIPDNGWSTREKCYERAYFAYKDSHIRLKADEVKVEESKCEEP